MLSYYWVEEEQGSGNNKQFIISNANDKRVVGEGELARAIRGGRVELLNYHLNPNDNTKITRLRTNIIIPEEKMFQGNMVNKLLDSYIAGKYIIGEHLSLIGSLFCRDRDAATNKFLGRLIDVVRLYFSYIDDVKVRVIIKIESHSIKLCKNAGDICNSYLMTRIESISNQNGLSTEFTKFKDKYEKDFQSYDYLLVLLKRIVNTTQYKNDVRHITKMLSAIINYSDYTFIGEQMDTKFCDDLLDKYKKSVYDNVQLDLTRLTNTERQSKADECCKLLAMEYNKYNEKLVANKIGIIQSIRNGGAEAVELMETLDKINSYDYDLTDTSGNITRDEYEEYLRQKVAETKELIKSIEQSLRSKRIGRTIRAIGTAADLGADAMLNSNKPATIGAGAVIKSIKSAVETDKLAEEITDYCLSTNLPDDIYKVLNKLRGYNLFVMHIVLYMYDKKLASDIGKSVNKKLNNPFSRTSPLAFYFELEKEFTKVRKQKINTLTDFASISYESSYLRAMSDLMTVDSRNVLIEAYDEINKDKLLSSEGAYTDRRHLEKAWIPAYKILMYDIERNKIPNLYIENCVFWKLVEDIYVALKLNRCEEIRNKNLDKYMKAFNKVYGTKFERSRDNNINIMNIVKNVN